MVLILIGLGGALGSITRYSVGKYISNKSKITLPIGTIIINITGAFLLGIVSNSGIDGNIYLLITEGFLGAFTTFSTFMYEGFVLIQENEKLNIVIYIIGTILLGLIGFTLGYYFMWLI